MLLAGRPNGLERRGEQRREVIGAVPADGQAGALLGTVDGGRVFKVGFSETKYPEIRRHYRKAVRAGWLRILVLNRKGADARRDRLLDDDVLGLPTRDGYDRDESPPAIGRGRGPKALRQGSDPTGWKVSVAYVPSSENRSHGSTMGIKLRRFCAGQRFRCIFY